MLFCLVLVSRLRQPPTTEQAISDEVCNIRWRCYSIELTVHVSRRTAEVKRGRRTDTVVVQLLLLSKPHQVVCRENEGLAENSTMLGPMALGKPQIEEVTVDSSTR